MLSVKPSGTRSWLQRLVVGGVRKTFGLGPYPVVSLAEARNIAFENVRKRHQGIDPSVRARPARAVPTFAEAADACIASRRRGWKAGTRNEGNWRSTLGHAAPLAGVPVDAVDADAVVAVVRRLVDAGKTATAAALAQRIKAILEWASDEGHRTGPSPVNGRVERELARRPHTTEHHEAVPFAEVPAAIAKIRALTKPTWRGMVAATEFAILTGARSNEATGATWDEIDLATRTWTVPVERMKGKRPHRVPLSGAALALLDTALDRTGGTGLVFRSPRGLRIDRLIPVLRKAGIGADMHGFRSSLRDWAAESGVDDGLGEMLLAHYPTDRTIKSYYRSDRFAERVPVMERWARHCNGAAG